MITIDSIVIIDDENLQVRYTPINDMEESLPTTSLVHAAWTTCHGQLLLYKYLDMVRLGAAYHDKGEKKKKNPW